MEIVTVKFQEDILHKIDENIARHNYNSRTEFIREAVRDKMANLSREELINKFMKFRGSASKKTTDEENRATREKVFKEFIKEKGWG